MNVCTYSVHCPFPTKRPVNSLEIVVHTAGQEEFVLVIVGDVVAVFVFGMATAAGTTEGCPAGMDTDLEPPVRPGPDEKANAAWVDATSPAATREVLKNIVIRVDGGINLEERGIEH